MGHGHELFLVHHNSECVPGCLIAAEIVYRLYFSASETHIVIRCPDIECCRAVQGIDGDQVFDTVGVHVLNKTGDTR